MNIKSIPYWIIIITVTLVFVVTSVLIILSLFRIYTFEDSTLQKRLFYFVIVQSAIASVVAFRRYLLKPKDSRLLKYSKNFSLIHGQKNCINSMIKTVDEANDFIFTIGGRSRDVKYLNAIANRVKKGNVHHIRVITGNHILHNLCVHLRDLGKNADLAYITEERFGNFLVTHDTTIIALQDAKKTNIYSILILKDTKVASEFRQYISGVFGQDNKTVDNTLIKSLCLSCRENVLKE